MSEQKYREWWLGKGSGKAYGDQSIAIQNEDHGVVHVIEKAAYEELQKYTDKLLLDFATRTEEMWKARARNAELEKLISEFDGHGVVALKNKDLNELRAQLEIAMDCLDEISKFRSQHFLTDEARLAGETLAKIRGGG